MKGVGKAGEIISDGGLIQAKMQALEGLYDIQGVEDRWYM